LKFLFYLAILVATFGVSNADPIIIGSGSEIAAVAGSPLHTIAKGPFI